MDERRRSIATWAAVAALLTLTLFLYAGSYYLLVEPVNVVEESPGPAMTQPRYAYGGVSAEVVFAPVHQLDRRVRTNVWNPPQPYSDPESVRLWNEQRQARARAKKLSRNAIREFDLTND